MSSFFIVNVHIRQKPSESHKILQPLILQSFWQRFSLASWSSTFKDQIQQKNRRYPKNPIEANQHTVHMSGFNYTSYKLFGVRWFAFYCSLTWCIDPKWQQDRTGFTNLQVDCPRFARGVCVKGDASGQIKRTKYHRIPALDSLACYNKTFLAQKLATKIQEGSNL